MSTDTTERGLEDLIVRAMAGRTDLVTPAHTATINPAAGGTGWILGDPHHDDRGFGVDLVHLLGFVQTTPTDSTTPSPAAPPTPADPPSSP